jgi:hypothetical protein
MWNMPAMRVISRAWTEGVSPSLSERTRPYAFRGRFAMHLDEDRQGLIA